MTLVGINFIGRRDKQAGTRLTSRWCVPTNLVHIRFILLKNKQQNIDWISLWCTKRNTWTPRKRKGKTEQGLFNLWCLRARKTYKHEYMIDHRCGRWINHAFTHIGLIHQLHSVAAQIRGSTKRLWSLWLRIQLCWWMMIALLASGWILNQPLKCGLVQMYNCGGIKRGLREE